MNLSPTQRFLARAIAALFPNIRIMRMALHRDQSLVEHAAQALDHVNAAAIEARLRRGEHANGPAHDGGKPLKISPGIVASMLQSLGVRADAGFLADLAMLEHRGDFTACRQPADHVRLWLRLKLQQVGEG